MSSSASSSDYATDEELEEPISAGGSSLISHLELPDLATCMIHETRNNIEGSLDACFPMLPETIMANANAEGKISGRRRHSRHEHETLDKISKDMNNLRRQNVITHCLLGTLIVLTLGWQLSEVSLILTFKDGFTHPFRSIANFLSRRLKKRTLADPVDATKEEDSPAASSALVPIQPPPVMLGMKMPELPKFLDISKWGQNGNWH